MSEQMNIIIVEPGKQPRKTTIDDTLEDMRQIVGGTIQAIYPWDDRHVGLVCNDDGIALGLPFNRFVEERDYGPIMGTFFLCGLSDEDFQSLEEDDAEFLMERFKPTEHLVRTLAGKLVIVRGTGV